MIDTKQFVEAFARHGIIGCLVRSPEFFYFLTNEDTRRTYDMSQHIVAYYVEEGEEKWASGEFYDWGASIIGFSSTEPKCVVASKKRKIWSAGGGSSEEEKKVKLDKSGERGCRGNFRKMREIDGALYVCGNNRNVGVRQGIDDWKWLTEDIHFPRDLREDNEYSENMESLRTSVTLSEYSAQEYGTEIGFNDISGFSKKDIYAVGGYNDAWHYDGNAWIKLDFPRPPKFGFLNVVCCGGDDKVYVASNRVGIYQGKENDWELIPFNTGNYATSIVDMAWCDGRLWLTGMLWTENEENEDNEEHESKIWWLEDGRLVEAEIPESIKRYGGSLSTRDGVLLVAGKKGAAYLEDGHWNILFDYDEMWALAEKEGLLLGVTTNLKNDVEGLQKKEGESGSAYSYGNKEREYFTGAPECEYIQKALKGKHVNSYSDREAAELILNDPELPNLNSLIVGVFWDWWESMQDVLDVFVENREKLQHIESLYFGRDADLIETVPGYSGDYSELLEALPNLRNLVLWGGDELSLGDNISHKELRHLEIISGGLPYGVLEQLSEASLPALETLIIYTDNQSADSIEPLLSEENFPALKTLGLLNSHEQGEIAMMVMDSEILPQLETLYLCYGMGLDDEAGEYILENADQFESLKELHMHFNNFSDEMMKELLQLPFKVNISLPQGEGEWDFPLLDNETFPEIEDRERDWLEKNDDSIFGVFR